jgi:2',3'-cyclic-nucleotide 2'-phosphodiesterase (5'-nucleotidase family)
MKLINCFFLLLLVSCGVKKQAPLKINDDLVHLTILQLNDIYEIAPIEGGKAGGMARVANLRKQLVAKNKNTLTIVSGDFLNPSVIGTLKYEGKPIKGRQMVEVMNAVGVDLAIFGNHEFDLDIPDLQQRMNESKFNWTSTNAKFVHKNGTIGSFYKVVDGDTTFVSTNYLHFVIDSFGDSIGPVLKIGFFGVVLNSNFKDYVHYENPTESAKKAIADLKDQGADLLVGITHLNIEDDVSLAKELQNVPLLLGGHDHNWMQQLVGNTNITKGDANAKSVWAHEIYFNRITKKTTIDSKRIKIDQTLTEDPDVAGVVKKWTDIADASLLALGINGGEVIADLKIPLDARESSLRFKQTLMGTAIAESMTAAADKPTVCAIFNSGALRLDDQLSGVITQMDIVRTLPYGGKLIELDIVGKELLKVLNTGIANIGKGGYLQWDGIDFNAQTKVFKLKLKGRNNVIMEDAFLPIDEAKTYHIVLNDFMLTGKETGFEFLTPKNPNLSNIVAPDPNNLLDINNDIRKVFIKYLKSKK